MKRKFPIILSVLLLYGNAFAQEIGPSIFWPEFYPKQFNLNTNINPYFAYSDKQSDYLCGPLFCDYKIDYGGIVAPFKSILGQASNFNYSFSTDILGDEYDYNNPKKPNLTDNYGFELEMSLAF